MKALLTGLLFTTTAIASPDQLVNELELTIGTNISQSQVQLIHDSMPTLGEQESFMIHDVFSEPSFRKMPRLGPGSGDELRVCVERCEGTGEEKVCWQVCVDDS